MSGDWNARLSFRAFLALLGVMALVLQPFTVSLAHASNMTWIEICSEEGGTYVQVDLSRNDANPQNTLECCADCPNCVICASAMTGLSHEQGQGCLDRSGLIRATMLHAQIAGADQERAWPETRGPPTAKLEKPNFAARGEIAAIPNLEGDAL